MEIPELIPVESSNIDSIGYDEQNHNLYVGFKNQEGTMWMYNQVPADVFEALRFAGSVGAYYAKFIKPVYKGHQLWNMNGVWKMLK